MKKILIGVSGGIAAYKICSLISLLKGKTWNIKIVMTKNAQEFVRPLTFEALSGNRVYAEMFGGTRDEIDHIALGDWADMLLIAPATANIIGKIANGIADDLLSTTVLAISAETPKYIAPAMNTRMWLNPAVQKNIGKLKHWGWRIIEPQKKRLACGQEGIGALADLSEIIKSLEKNEEKKRA